MKVNELLNLLQQVAPLEYAEDFDNTGLLVGNRDMTITGVLVTLDTLESVVEEAISKNCNFILSFHPIIFSGLKKLTGSSYVERTVAKALKNDIAIYAIHTALDNSWNGVNQKICTRLGLKNNKILIPQRGTIKKLTTYVPKNEAQVVRTALFAAGAGEIGNYSNCSFNSEGKGTFQGNPDSNPSLGKKGILQTEDEIEIGITFAKHLEGKIIKALFESHSYEEVAYEITTLENLNQHIGMGMIGELDKELSEKDFLNLLKSKMQTSCIRHSSFLQKKIKKVAVLGGSGSFAIDLAKRAGADAFVSSDFKYHDFFKAENSILLADIGHYESEQFTKDLLVDVLTKKISNFAVVLSETNTNPISYF